ncbi:MAG: peptidase [Burkholderiales bacterium PBB5]|nr:MAG: peptidase [Burkholderiales bacterium PBB5]
MPRSLLATACLLACAGTQAATINITSRDPAGVGFNDPTVVSPVGGNPGTTLGQQRYNVYRYVADIWEKNIASDVTINVSAGWEALTCTSTSATLGSAGAWNTWHDFPGGKPGTWYPQALANKLAGVDLSAGVPDDGSGYGNFDIKTQFNVNLGNAGCLDGNFFYLGLDGKAGTNVNFVETLLHELGHGLGFSVLTVQTSTGFRVNAAGTAYSSTGLPSVWEQFMLDNSTGKTWLAMTNAERKASAINPLKLAWTGPNAVAGAATTLGNAPVLRISTSVPGVAGGYLYNTAGFGPAVSVGQSIGTLANIKAQLASVGQGCNPLDAADAAAVAGKVAIIDRGVCSFVIKVKNAQNAGAIGVVIANNAAGAAPGLGGSDATIVIPTISVSQSDGATLKTAITNAPIYGSRSKPGSVVGALAIDPTRKAGTDAAGRPLLYTPNPLVGGSSVSHWDVSAFPNLLMEPNINSDLGTVMVAPKDLTVPLLKDLGW